MARTFIRPETQIKTLDTFDDQVASGSGLETTTWNMEQFLQGVISQLNRFLNTTTSGNDWFAGLTAPTTFESGAVRGIDEINQDLHDTERKRVLRSVANLTDITVPASVKATGTLTTTGQPANNDQVQIGGQTYTYKTTLTPAANEVLLGASQATAMENLRRAINDDGVAGVNYGTGTVANAFVSATDTATTVVCTALKGGTQGNSISTTDPVDTGGVMNWSGTTLSGGSGGDVVVLALSELPTNTTAAIGSVTTLGTVAAYQSTFATASSTAVVTGTTAIAPKNITEIVDGDTRDPILDGSGKRVWALFQSESNTDGSTMTGTTPNRAQLSFVVVNDAGDGLQLVDGDVMGGQEINYASVERVGLLDLNEQDFLRGAIVDVPGGTTVSRQVAYDNQGTTPVDVTTHSYLDLEGAGLVWQIRDDNEAILFGVTENSGTSASTVLIGSDVDVFDVDAVLNNFLNGASFDTGAAGTTINVGVTANQIDSGGALTVASGGAGDLKLDAAALLAFTDQYQAGSTYSTDLVLSDSSAEWDAFETEFGEVSILNAIVQASGNDNRHRATASVSTTITANTLIEGPNGPGTANISADLLDYRNVTFVDDVEIFVNGQLMLNGVDAAANNDVYPSATATPDQQYGCFYAEFNLKASPGNADVIQMFITGALT